MPHHTPLHDWHQAHGGRMVDFAGWLLPLRYQPGTIAEHLNTRKYGGIFDICHMGRFLVTGPRALDFLARTLTNDPARLCPGLAHYSLISDPQGRPVDDVYLFHFRPGEYLLVVNGANREKDWEWLQARLPQDARLQDITWELAMLALQGPRSQETLASLVEGELPPPGRNRLGTARWRGVQVLVSRTGYTGEPLGFELFLPWSRALDFWQALVRAGRERGLHPAGLGARDTLRLEAGLPLYGHELTPDRPIFSLPQARFAVNLHPGRGHFVGQQALAAQAKDLEQEHGQLVPRRIVPVVATYRGMIRPGAQILVQGQVRGEVTSGTSVPAWRFLGQAPGKEHYTRALGLAYVDRSLLSGQAVEITYRHRLLPARVVNSFMKQAGIYLCPMEFK